MNILTSIFILINKALKIKNNFQGYLKHYKLIHIQKLSRQITVNDNTYKNRISIRFFHPDFTVGPGVSPGLPQ